MEHFLYVFSKHDRDVLLERGYSLIQSNDVTHTYVFENRTDANFSLNNITAIPSDVISL